MTLGNPLPLMVKFALPPISGSLLQQFYSFVATAHCWPLYQCRGANIEFSCVGLFHWQYYKFLYSPFVFGGDRK